MKLFDRDGNGADEITSALGMISNRVDFNTWKPILPLGIRDVAAIIGREPIKSLSDFYQSEKYLLGMTNIDRAQQKMVKELQQSVAFFTWLKIIPTLDAQHDINGRSRRLGENEKGMTALEQYKDEANILRLAYEAVDALIESMNDTALSFWTQSEKYKQRKGLLINTKEQFDVFYTIGSHRLFLTLLPMIREVQNADIRPIIGNDYIQILLCNDKTEHEALYETAGRAIALLTMKKAVERLPVEVLPDGIVQVNQQTPVNQKLKAEKEARNAVIASLGADAARYLRQLEDIMAELTAKDGEDAGYYQPGPIVHSKGMTF